MKMLSGQFSPDADTFRGRQDGAQDRSLPGAMSRSGTLRCLVFLIAGGMLEMGQAQAPSLLLKGPWLQGPGSNTMTIKWEAATNAPALMRYGLNGKLDRLRSVQPARSLQVESYFSATNVSDSGVTNINRIPSTNSVYLFEAELTNLEPAGVYSYQVEFSNVRTEPKQFRTFSLRQPKVTFLAYGDDRTNPKIHAAVAGNFKRYAPEFILHTGDLVANGQRYELWEREFFGPLANVLDEVPLLPSVGNHESDGKNYLFYMKLPGKERWYSSDLGPVHVLALDFHYDKESDEQFAFAERDLMESKAPWKIVFLHYPVFNIGGHGTGWGHAHYLPLFHRAKVDMVVSGHSHIYERFRTIRGEEVEARWPITFITTGGGGAPLANSLPHPALVSRAATNHFVLFEATATSLKGRVITTNNVVIDEFGWEKQQGQPSPNYLAQTYPEEALKAFYEAAPSVTGALASLPGTNAVARAMFTIRPITTARRPVEMEIGLMPESARYYELEEPLRVQVPSSAESNKVVWAKIRTRKDPRTGDGRPGDFLSPPLIFQGRMDIQGAEALVYGQKARLSQAAIDAARNAD